MAGAQLVVMYGFGMVHDGMGLMHVVNSYLDDLVVSITSDREMMPDPAFYAECLTDSIRRAVHSHMTRPCARRDVRSERQAPSSQR